MKFDGPLHKSTIVDFDVGRFCIELAKKLFPIYRSITGQGVRDTLAHIKHQLPALSINEVKSGTQVFDWIVPDEWVIRDAYVTDASGLKIIDFMDNNLHVVGYSEPIDKWLDLDELNTHLYSKPDQPDAIPYVTSYYERRWGFCLTHNQRQALTRDLYHVVVDSELRAGVLNFGELILHGQTTQEILLSTYICHPSMANNELSGPVVTVALAKWLMSLECRRFTYRIVFIPETIGSITYLSQHHDHLKKNVVAGFNVTCIGDDRCYSYLPSRDGDTLSDRAALHALKHIDPNFKKYTWMDRGSDERQYCAPGIDLPVATIMRSKYGEYKEYHTSHDDLSVISEKGLAGGFNALQQAIEAIENNLKLRVTVLCEPRLGKRGLYPNFNSQESYNQNVRMMMDAISYCDGNRDLLEIAELIDVPISRLVKILQPLLNEGLLESFQP